MGESEGPISELGMRRRAKRRPVEGPIGNPLTRRSWYDRLIGRRQPTTYHRCLAVHIHFAGPRSALS
jgi:hypothetical protein